MNARTDADYLSELGARPDEVRLISERIERLWMDTASDAFASLAAAARLLDGDEDDRDFTDISVATLDDASPGDLQTLLRANLALLQLASDAFEVIALWAQSREHVPSGTALEAVTDALARAISGADALVEAWPRDPTT